MVLEPKFDNLVFESNASFSGTLTVLEKVSGPITLSLESSRCSLDMKTCEQFSVFNIRELCKKFVDINPIYTSLFGKISPPLKCPLAVGNYTLEETVIDLRLFEFMPVDGYFYNTVMKSTSAGKTAWCFKTEVKIVKTRVKNRRV
jgi:hypothetical protein